MIFKRINAVFNPECYHGWGINKRFFEGWYFKIISSDQNFAYAFIPGVAMDKNGKKQSFIQVLDGKKLTSDYHKFNFNDFKPSSYSFDVKILNNEFSDQNMILDLPNIKGKISFGDLFRWPSNLFSPGIMGPYSFVPFMECYHGIISMNHNLSGSLKINNKDVNFKNGKGYIEKDWGHSFPEAYIWLQCNNFESKNISIKASVAKIPWLNKSFIGFIAGLLINNKLIRFTTYNKSKINTCNVNNNEVELNFENNSYELKINVKRKVSTKLFAPIIGFMDKRVEESMDSIIHITLYNKKNNEELFSEKGTSAAIEVAGKYRQLIK